MRPSGLHINKPVIFGVIAVVVLLIFLYTRLRGSNVASPVVVELEPETLDTVPELKDGGAEIKRESKEIDVKVEDKTVKVHVEQAVKDSNPILDVLFLHGAKFSSKNWQDIGSTSHVANWNHRAIAIDLPAELDKALAGKFLAAFIKTLEMKKVVIIAPSASGLYALPYLFNDPASISDLVVGFVPIAPVGTTDFKEKFASSKIQTLIVYGSKDDQGVATLNDLKLIPNNKVAQIEDAGHACYLDKPEVFHKVLYHFLKELVP